MSKQNKIKNLRMQVSFIYEVQTLKKNQFSLIVAAFLLCLASCSSDTQQESSTSIKIARCKSEMSKFDELIKASDNGDYQALKVAADMLSNGYLDDSCSKIYDKEKAIEYYEFAAKNGNKEASVMLSTILQSEKNKTEENSQGNIVNFFSGKWIDKEAAIEIAIARNGSLSLYSATTDQLFSEDEKIELDKNISSRRRDVFHSAKERSGYWDAIKEVADIEAMELIKNTETSVVNKISGAAASLIIDRKCKKTFGYSGDLLEFKEDKISQFSISPSLPFLRLECPTETKILVATRGNSNELIHLVCKDRGCSKFPELTRNPVSSIRIPVRLN